MNFFRHLLFTGATLLGSSILFAGPAHATLLVYEGFQYDTPGTATDGGSGDPLVGNPDGDPGDVDAIGLSGSYSGSGDTATATLRLKDGGSLDTSGRFSGLTTAGNHVATDTSRNSTIANRGISATLDGSSDLWFSAVMQPIGSNGASQGGIAVTSTNLPNTRIRDNGGTTGLSGFGIGSESSQNWRAYVWENGVQITGSAGLSTSNGENYLMVGHYDTTADTFQLYEYTGAVGSGTLNPVGSSISADVFANGDLDTLNVTRQRLAAYDEIRIGTTLDDALGIETVIPEPSASLLVLLGTLGLAMRRRR